MRVPYDEVHFGFPKIFVAEVPPKVAVLRPRELQLEVFLGNFRRLNNDIGLCEMIVFSRESFETAVSRVPVFFSG